ncbi:hypothetical protein PILCRDRAFT_494873 [Piloderma croceum F 1598]|uniref:Uncharacterized protein n=1 Tax=Piloderma croceum (strain F 1598) TaxID=765440 RepID=A0A0C3FQR4_PILCF|nr:hypothetical protein PILCRDRAFT_494873 [Piloderma croceum F 1598]
MTDDSCSLLPRLTMSSRESWIDCIATIEVSHRSRRCRDPACFPYFLEAADLECLGNGSSFGIIVSVSTDVFNPSTRFRKLLHRLKCITKCNQGGGLGIYEARNRTRRTSFCGFLFLSSAIPFFSQLTFNVTAWSQSLNKNMAPANRYSAIQLVRIACFARLQPTTFCRAAGVSRSKLHREFPGNKVAVDMLSSFCVVGNLSAACDPHVWLRALPPGRVRRTRRSLCQLAVKIVFSGKHGRCTHTENYRFLVADHPFFSVLGPVRTKARFYT